MERQYPEKDDKLRARFTSWLTTLLRRARIDYLRRLGREPNTIAILFVESCCKNCFCFVFHGERILNGLLPLHYSDALRLLERLTV